MAASIVLDSPVVNAARKCRFCERQDASYTCPRCNCPYCSSNCYKCAKHVQCSELFYRDWVETHLRNTENSPDAQRRVTDILRRVYRNDEALDSDDDEDVPELRERLSEIDLESSVGNEDQIWDKLTDAEKQEFKNLLERGDLDSILPLWNPWWRYKEKIELVKEIGGQTQPNSSLMRCPPVRENIPSLNQLISVPVSPNVKYNLVNVLYAYAYVVCFYNGDHHEFPTESMENVLKLSSCLTENQNYSDSLDAITHVNHALEQNKEIANSQAFVIGIIDEVKCIVEGPGGDKKPSQTYILAALTDLEKMARNARKMMKMALSNSSKSTRNTNSDKELISKLRHVEKKLVFYMSWIKDHHQELFPVITELDLFHASKQQELTLFQKQMRELNNSRKKEVSKAAKIQEL